MGSFREWFKQKEITEAGTSTACVAHFSRIAIPLIRRIFAPFGIEDQDDFFNKDEDKTKKKKQKKDDKK